MPSNRLIIEYTAGVLKTRMRRRKTRKIQGKVRGDDMRMGLTYEENFGKTESTRCLSLERAQERCSHQGKYAYGHYSDTIKKAIFYDADGLAHDVTPQYKVDRPGQVNYGVALPPVQAGHVHGTRAMRAKLKRECRKLERDMEVVNRRSAEVSHFIRNNQSF